MEPYREDRPIIYIDKDKIKQNILETILSLPGARALKNFHDNPEGSATETLDLLAEDIVPFYGNYRNGGDIGDYVKEAAMLGIPMPYTKFPKGHPKAGEAIPNNLKEGLGYGGWASTKSGWKYNNAKGRKLYTLEEILRKQSDVISSRNRINRNHIEVPNTETYGPYSRTNTGSNIQNQGQQANRTNSVIVEPRGPRGSMLNGVNGWQGEMYPPGRRLRNDEMYGPFQWEDKYSRKLDAAIDENEYKWEYLINKTRQGSGRGSKTATVVPKDNIISIALEQGRPDIAERIALDNKPRITGNTDPKFPTYRSIQQHTGLDDANWKDLGNRALEKELRETFASLPNDPDIRYRFAEHYGVPDLYQSWLNDPLPWDKLKEETKSRRYHREATIRNLDRKYGRTIQR